MEAIYRLNTNDLGIGFVNSLQAAYPGKTIKITVREEDDPDFDETEYLNRSPANREHLDKAMKNVAEGKLISFNTIEEARQCAEKWAAEN
ncbi:MAG: hypothetical protein FWF86_09715 [Clostridia bacterium]|nr:hypothetical protein [Clostridia bacterium]